MLSYAIKVGITASIVAASFAATAAAKPGKISTPDYLRDTFTVERVLDWGSRPIWSADSKRIVFTRDDKSPSPAYELDLKTRKVRCLTCRFEKAGLVQRIYYLPDDSLLILGPPGLDAARPAPNTVQPGASEL